MATGADETDVIEAELETENDQQTEDEQQDDESGEQETEGEQGEQGEDDGVVVTIGDEQPPTEEDDFDGQPAPQWVKELRERNREVVRENREKERRIRELEQRINAGQQDEQAVVVGEKPTLEGCDYDAERFEKELTAYHDRKRQVEQQAEQKRKTEEQAQAAWNARLEAYGKAKTELKVKDFQDAEEAVKDVLNVTQQGIIISGAENSAVLVYALGKNPAKAKELAAIADPVKFAFAIAKLETQLKVTPRKAPPPPDKQVRGSARVAMSAVDAKLEALQKEADRTGDRTKVVQYLRNKNRQQ